MKPSTFSLTTLRLFTMTTLAAILTFAGSALAETVIHTFHGPDGGQPTAGLVARNHGTLYGATELGGQYGHGAVFELAPPTTSGGAWTETVLYSFLGQPDGDGPSAGLIFDKEGNLWGTTAAGGVNDTGTVFQLTPPAVPGGSWTEAVVHSFKSSGNPTDGASPFGGLTLGWEGSLYGTTIYGGASNVGALFKLTKLKTGAWTESLIHSFADNGSDGFYPSTSLIADKAGNLYGTTIQGGRGCEPGYCGTIFELSPPTPGGSWTESILYRFTGGGDGTEPLAALILDSAGNLYGTTIGGGGGPCSITLGCGTVFELSPASGAWSESILYSFTGGSDGANPRAGLVLDQAGNLYGTASAGGIVTGACSPPGGCGTVFQLSPPTTPGGTWSENTLHDFGTGWEGTHDGIGPYGNIIFGKYGALYGTTADGGGRRGLGTVFSIHP